MDALQIKAFIDAMAASELAELEASKDGWTLRLVRGPMRHARRAGAATTRQAQADSAAASSTSGYEQGAPLAGTVFLQPAPGEPAFVAHGQTVKAGQTLCVIEAMKVFNEVAAERDGVVETFLVRSGQEIDAGQPLLRLR